MKKNTFNEWLLRFLFCVAIILVYHMMLHFNLIFNFFNKILKILKPFIIGSLIAFLLFPTCKRVEMLLLKVNKSFIKKRVRPLATAIVMVTMVFLVVSFFVKIVPIFYEALLKFTEEISYYFADGYEYLEEKIKNISFLSSLLKEIENQFSFDKLTKFFASLSYKAYFGGILNLIFKIFNIFIGLIISIYILIERYNIKKSILRGFNVTLKKENVNRIIRLWRKTKKIIYTFIFGQIIDAFIVGCLIGIFFSLFKIKDGLIFAVIYFVFATIPYFGSIMAVFIISICSFVVGDFNEFLICFVISFVLQQVDSNFINPKIVGQIVGIKPLYVILGITLFGGIFGFVGFFLGPPLMGVCLEFLDDFVKSKEIEKKRRIKRGE